MPNITSNPVTVIPPKTSGGSVKNAANLISYSAAAAGPQSELWGNVTKAFRDLQSQVDGIANSLRSALGIPDPIQVVDAQGNLVANIGTYVNPLTNGSFTGIWANNTLGGVAIAGDPIGLGAVGDGVHDDTIAVQQAINQSGGVLYLRPNKQFVISSTIVCPNVSTIVIYGGGFLVSNTNSLTMVSATSGNPNIRIYNIVFINNGTGGICLNISGSGAAWNEIRGCYFSPTSGTGLSLTNLSSVWSVLQCVFVGSTTGISLNTPIARTNIVDCLFSTALPTPIATSGAVTYNVKACAPHIDHYGDPVNRLYAEFTGTTQTFTAGGGFSNVTSCSFTITATGVWQISMNAFVQQTAGATNQASIRFSRNGTGDLRTVGGGNGSGQYSLHGDLQIALTSGDTIALQCACGGANASILGSGDQAMTNISAWLIGDS